MAQAGEKKVRLRTGGLDQIPRGNLGETKNYFLNFLLASKDPYAYKTLDL